jgi:hypothetical protein
MPTNPYINLTSFGPEQALIESLTIELIQGMGQNCYYVPRKYFNIDRIFGEDPATSFEKVYNLEMYIQSYKEFSGTDVITQFGLEIKDKVSLLFSRRRFREQVTVYDSEITRPREGDLIYFPLSKSLFEINFVEHENPLYPLGKLYSYQITAELFTYSYEKMTTPNANINSPYTSTRGLSGSTVIPLNNILGTTMGINDVLEQEGNSYGFDPNDPFNECSSDISCNPGST